jgi:Ca2+-binding EF-hand superfamily protein
MGEQFYKQPTEKELMEAFSYFDSDKNGYITENELYQVMTRFRGGVTREEVDRMVRGCDHDSDGKINKNGKY